MTIVPSELDIFTTTASTYRVKITSLIEVGFGCLVFGGHVLQALMKSLNFLSYFGHHTNERARPFNG